MIQQPTVRGTTGWTVETLKRSIDQRFIDNDKAVNAALAANKEAVIKAEILTDKRFDAVNKSMSDLAGQSSNLLSRTEYLANHKALEDRINVVTDTLNKSSGDKNLYATNSFVIETVSQSIGNLETKLENILKPLVGHVAAQDGAAQGAQLTMGKIGAMLGIFTAVLGIMIYFVSQIR